MHIFHLNVDGFTEVKINGITLQVLRFKREWDNISYSKLWKEIMPLDTLIFHIFMFAQSNRMRLPRYINAETNAFFDKLQTMITIALERLEKEE